MKLSLPDLFLWVLLAVSELTAAETWEVLTPGGLQSADGNAASRLPFAYLGSVHYQQVYSASEFTSIPEGGAFITLIKLRPDCLSIRNWFVSNVVVSLSTTGQGPDELSPVFSMNHGPDRITVFTDSDFIPPGDAVGCPSSFDASPPIRLAAPFFYNPARGNLLLDLQHEGIEWTGGSLSESLTDAHNVVGDSVSRIAAFSLSTEQAEIVDSVGMITLFRFYPAPTLTHQIQTNSLILTWATDPTTFRLQWSDTIGSPWADYPGTVGGGALYRIVSIPLSALPREKYFRLFWDTPQPLDAPDAPSAKLDPESGVDLSVIRRSPHRTQVPP